MIQAVYIFQIDSRKLLYSRNFQSQENLEMFSEFFSALQAFSSELSSDSDSLNTIALSDFYVSVNRIDDVITDLVLVFDKDDKKEIYKIIPKLTGIVIKYKRLFTNWDQDIETFEDFDTELHNLILSNKKLVKNSSLSFDQEGVLKSIWEQKGALSEQSRERMLKKANILKTKIANEEIFLKKFTLLKKLIKITERLQNDKEFITLQKKLQSLRQIIQDRKLRLQYYLDKVKESINKHDYAQTYSFMYSFCLKLEHLIDPYVITKYKKLTQNLLSNDTKSIEKNVKKILSLEKKMNEYISSF